MMSLLSVRRLKVYFKTASSLFQCNGDVLRAVDDVCFDIEKQKTVGLVGESGCGKTTIARAVIGLQPVTSGKIIFNQRNLANLSRNERRKETRKMRLIFQNPEASLNPHIRIGSILKEACAIRTGLKNNVDIRTEIQRITDAVQLNPSVLHRYPTQLSGGEKRRVMIARALFGKPKMIIGDEPISSLDPVIQNQIIDLFRKLQTEYQFSLMMISHNLDLIQKICDDIVVIFRGKVMEIGPEKIIFSESCRHPYTRLLHRAGNLENLEELIPAPGFEPTGSGCVFRHECPRYTRRGRPTVCREKTPELVNLGNTHAVACHFV